MTILVTGFEPFGGAEVNPSWEAVKLLPEEIGGASIVKALLPTTFHGAEERLLEEIQKWNPDALISVGVAGGRREIHVERVAVNLRDARIPDNVGFQPVDMPVAEEGPAAYFATLPVKAMVEAIKEAGVPAAVSNSAGTFVCNDVMYTALHRGKVPMAGFVHVPLLPPEAAKKGEEGMELPEILRGLTVAVEAVARRET